MNTFEILGLYEATLKSIMLLATFVSWKIMLPGWIRIGVIAVLSFYFGVGAVSILRN